MNEPFVPLFPSAGAEPGASARPCHAKILPSSATSAPEAGGFVPAASPQCAAGRRGSPGQPPADAPPGQPVVTLQRDGDHVSRIHILCACGAVIDLDCAY